MSVFQPIIGIAVFISIAWILSENKKKIPLRFIGWGVFSQILLALIFLKMPAGVHIFSPLNKAVNVLQDVTQEAAGFMFGYLAGGVTPFEVKTPEANFIIAFRVLPLILVVSAISALLFYLKVLPTIIRVFSALLQKTFKISGPLGFGAASTVFLGTIEAPLMIKPYLTKLTRSELFSLLSCTMATVAGTVMVLYAGVLKQVIPNPMTHLLVASLMSVPAAMMIAAIMIPETNLQPSKKKKFDQLALGYRGPFDALIKGTVEGVQMIINIVGVIITFFALIYLFNRVLAGVGISHSIQQILGVLLRPLMWLTGISWNDSALAGELMGTKIILNEFVSYLELSKVYSQFSDSTRLILTYCLCGFANLGSLGIVVGGLSTLLPERRDELIQLGMKSLVSGNLAVLITGAIAGLIAG